MKCNDSSTQMNWGTVSIFQSCFVHWFLVNFPSKLSWKWSYRKFTSLIVDNASIHQFIYGKVHTLHIAKTIALWTVFFLLFYSPLHTEIVIFTICIYAIIVHQVFTEDWIVYVCASVNLPFLYKIFIIINIEFLYLT